jgi:hypothetical protein
VVLVALAALSLDWMWRTWSARRDVGASGLDPPTQREESRQHSAALR